MSARILCVEDNPQNMRLVRKILTHQGYDVLEAEDGLTGVQVAIDEYPDLILMDINLPDIDGLEATQRLKNNDATHNIPIVALTANAMYGDEERALAAGCDGYISKPVSKTKLLALVDKFIDERDQQQASSADAAAAASSADSSESSSSPATNNTPDSSPKKQEAPKSGSQRPSPAAQNPLSSQQSHRAAPKFQTEIDDSGSDDDSDTEKASSPEAQHSTSRSSSSDD